MGIGVRYIIIKGKEKTMKTELIALFHALVKCNKCGRDFWKPIYTTGNKNRKCEKCS